DSQLALGGGSVSAAHGDAASQTRQRSRGDFQEPATLDLWRGSRRQPAPQHPGSAPVTKRWNLPFLRSQATGDAHAVAECEDGLSLRFVLWPRNPRSIRTPSPGRGGGGCIAVCPRG